jgi:hypothetical protein
VEATTGPRILLIVPADFHLGLRTFTWIAAGDGDRDAIAEPR